MATNLLFFATLAAEILAALSVGFSIARPYRRIWPPPRIQAWQRYWMILLFAFSGAGVIALGLLDWDSGAFLPWIRWGVGVPLWGAGNAMAIWAAAALRLPATFGAEGAFVSRGPYKYSRNPQYLGFIAALFGYALLAASNLTLVAAILGTIPLILVPFSEEGWLQEKYGATYEAYRRDVPRFFSLKR